MRKVKSSQNKAGSAYRQAGSTYQQVRPITDSRTGPKVSLDKRPANKNHRTIPRPVVVISGPSGSGQTSLAAALLKKRKNLGLVRGTTTRPRQKRRGGDRDHIFITRPQFLARQKRGAFIETDYNAGHYYGTSLAEIKRVWRQHSIPLLTLTVDGFRALKKNTQFSVCSLFVKAESLSELKRRILKRQKDLSAAQVKARLREAKKALRAQKQYRHVIINRKDRFSFTVKKAVKYVDGCLELR